MIRPTENMRAVAFRRGLPVEDPESLLDIELPVPRIGPRDLLVMVEAVSVNPVDVWLRADREASELARVLGFDAAGTVLATGASVTRFRPGDEVFYAGSIDRPGTDAQLHAVDERIVGTKPATLDFARAAALPLTAITAWETLFDRFRLKADSEGILLVLGGAGGVGSILIQLAKELTSMTVIATASRAESAEWVRRMGADHVIDHSVDLGGQIEAIVPGGVTHVLSPHSDGMIDTFAEIIAPGGEIVAIDEPHGLDLLPLKAKSITWHWELMFTRPVFQTEDMIEQGRLLDLVSGMVDAGRLRTTLREQLSPIDAENLRRAHAIVESGRAVGKVVVSGWE
ncbi:MAG TPA: zinc-binding alcohol dehydrogenase family protein [Solirubrobacterales bacterium]|nr:zinc-binding alcohol dehydrogenase family protein [Solirubrobacterales bacterium]